jgi:RND family efflux transporter MFP subunit
MTRLNIIGVLILASCALALSGCEKGSAKAAPAPPTVTVAQPITREVQDFDEYQGQMAAVDTVEIRARVRGYLKSIGFKDGDEVKEKQTLFEIDPEPFKAQVQVAEGQLDVVKARRQRADADVKRYKDLVPKGAATQQDLDKAIAELGEAEAGIRAAEAQVQRAKLDLGYATLTAPIAGLISKSNLSVGNLIGAGSDGEQLLTTIVSIDPIYVYFDVDQRTAQRYREQAVKRLPAGAATRPTRDLNIAFEFGLASDQGFPGKGVVDFIDTRVDAATGTVSVRGEVKNPDRRFKPGFFTRVRVPMSGKYRAVLVAEKAIGTQQGEKYVLTVDKENKVVLRKVELGALQSDDLRVIRSGLSGDERVVVNGMQRARPKATVTAQAGEMPVRPVLPDTQPAATQPVVLGH